MTENGKYSNNLESIESIIIKLNNKEINLDDCDLDWLKALPRRITDKTTSLKTQIDRMNKLKGKIRQNIRERAMITPQDYVELKNEVDNQRRAIENLSKKLDAVKQDKLENKEVKND